MSDQQYAATVRELQRVTLLGLVPQIFEADHVQDRPELVPARRDRIAYELQMRRAEQVPAARRGSDTRRNVSRSRHG